GPNRPHISSDTSNFKERERQNQTDAPLILGAPRLITSRIFRNRLVTLRPRERPNRASAPPVKGYLRLDAEGCNPFFQALSFFLRILILLLFINSLDLNSRGLSAHPVSTDPG
ncbi:MAG: hypothetical protein NXH74_12245, partial [Rhodobacteraceae bacterium]|nr:hypothetical protein [Paracoccaceae bacterium]